MRSQIRFIDYIETKFCGPTNFKGARIRVTFHDNGNKKHVFVHRDDSIGGITETHIAAIKEALGKLEMKHPPLTLEVRSTGAGLVAMPMHVKDESFQGGKRQVGFRLDL